MTWKVVHDIFLNNKAGYKTECKHASNFVENMYMSENIYPAVKSD